MEQQNPIQNAVETVSKQFSEMKLPTTESISTGMNSTINAVGNTFTNAQESISKTLNDFSSQSLVNANQDFLNSNSIIAKVVFLLLVLIVFLFLVNLGIKMIYYFSTPAKATYVINGVVPGSANINVSQNPGDSNSATIYRSNNETTGIEFTWSVWLNINGLANGSGKCSKLSHIFNKGNNNFSSSTGVADVNNAPGVYICEGNNTLRVYMDTFSSNNNYLEITNIPLKKWFHCAIRLQNKILDVYINGVIVARKVLDGVPKQNYDNVYIGANSGFNGQISNLVYYDSALSVFGINNIILRGPNMTQSGAVSTNKNYYTYLSNDWYSSKL
jgi:hypothetical protein